VKSSVSRVSASRQEAIMARVSPSTMSGSRELRRKIRYASSFSCPSRTIRTGGTSTPSW
jgi:hypothetical protein